MKRRGLSVTLLALAVFLGLAVARRVRAPLLLLGSMLALSVAVALGRDHDAEWFVPFIVLLLAVYSAAAHTSGRQTLIAGGMTCALYVTDLVVIDRAGVTAETVVRKLFERVEVP